MTLPQLEADVFLTDGGIETTLIFDDGFDLPDFAAFPLLDRMDGRAALARYFTSYLDVARRDGVGIVMETPTWRASADWGDRLGYDADALDRVNRDAVALVRDIAAPFAGPATPVVVSGCVGPRGDGYAPGALMSWPEARDYHRAQVHSLAAAGADLVTAVTMLDPGEAVGIVDAAREAGLPVVVSFTVETDGALPTGQTLGAAVAEVDEATGAAPAYYMVNCAHPAHFAHVLDPDAAWTARLGGLRANASRASHAELDAATELDAGDPEELAGLYADLRAAHPGLRVLGGCCGTSHVHVGAISARQASLRAPSTGRDRAGGS
ncbi:MAG: homocysteine S-methyltransferase family protein [Acidimicrobiia bacterium]